MQSQKSEFTTFVVISFLSYAVVRFNRLKFLLSVLINIVAMVVTRRTRKGITMQKAFDVKELVLKLKDQGLDVAEDAAKIIVEQTLTWVEESVVLSENKYDDFAVPVIKAVKPFIMKEIDKIDGKEG